MKQIISIFFITCSIIATAQNKKYLVAMDKNASQLDTSRTIDQLQRLENNFERIARSEKNEWLPNYYVAYCNVSMAYSSQGNRVDPYCDKADIFAKTADSLNPNNSEIYSLKADIAAARLQVDPMSRYQKYGDQAAAYREKAKALDPTNPRPWFLEGMSKFYTPAAFGGGKDKAKISYAKASTLFDAFYPASSIHPNWGKKKNDHFLKECDK